jgi:myo-inositol-1(or 4)-monophosphatase
LSDEHDQIQSIAIRAGEISLRYFRELPSLHVETKGPLDLVTIADREVERFITAELARSFPDDGIFGEEGSFVESKSGRTWVIDPIDGTFNFLRGSQDWGISIGLFENGRPSFGLVNAPVRDEVFAGGRNIGASLNGEPLSGLRPFDSNRAAVGLGIHPQVPSDEGLRLIAHVVNDLKVAFRVTGSSVISLIDIAKGTVDGYIGLGIPSWDILGMLPCLEQLGVTTTINWKAVGLNTKLRFVCATSEFLKLAKATSYS